MNNLEQIFEKALKETEEIDFLDPNFQEIWDAFCILCKHKCISEDEKERFIWNFAGKTGRSAESLKNKIKNSNYWYTITRRK